MMQGLISQLFIKATPYQKLETKKHLRCIFVIARKKKETYPSFRVKIAVCTASSSSISSVYLHGIVKLIIRQNRGIGHQL